ncbi:MAG: hypothetical protein MSG64_04490 [Pyrinomonadaceae bacterium MAG19_C2-C3]|nr:hypothetical protein [Pyrinomonadaceae bacterium MAG19_C2-C3]
MTKAISIIVALLTVFGLASGFMYLRSKFIPPATTIENRATAPRPLKIQIAEDELFLRKGQVVIGGTVRNISPDTLENLSLILELKNKSGQSEARAIRLEPTTLIPAAETRYSLLLPAGSLSSVRVVQVNQGELGINFKTTDGNARPLETPPPNKKTIVVERAPRSKAADDFINTPDNPYTLR